MINELMMNQIIVSVILATLVCQIWKVIDSSFKKKKLSPEVFFANGGMPSSHSTFVCSLATSIGLVEGFLSSIFFLSVGLAAIVVRDAFGVRHIVDQVREAVNEIIKKEKIGVNSVIRMAGHTPVQVSVGVILGIVIPLIISIAF